VEYDPDRPHACISGERDLGDDQADPLTGSQLIDVLPALERVHFVQVDPVEAGVNDPDKIGIISIQDDAPPRGIPVVDEIIALPFGILTMEPCRG